MNQFKGNEVALLFRESIYSKLPIMLLKLRCIAPKIGIVVRYKNFSEREISKIKLRTPARKMFMGSTVVLCKLLTPLICSMSHAAGYSFKKR